MNGSTVISSEWIHSACLPTACTSAFTYRLVSLLSLLCFMFLKNRRLFTRVQLLNTLALLTLTSKFQINALFHVCWVMRNISHIMQGYFYNMCFNAVFVCLYVQSLFAAIKQKVKENFPKSRDSLLYIPENIRHEKCRTRSSIISRKCGTYACTSHALRG